MTRLTQRPFARRSPGPACGSCRPRLSSSKAAWCCTARARHLFIRQRTSVINAIRAHLAEFGIVAPVGRHGVEELLTVVADPSDKRVPDIARACLAALGAQLRVQPVHGRRTGGHPLRGRMSAFEGILLQNS